MKINLRVSSVSGKIWLEDYNRPEIATLAQAEEWGKKLVQNFNDTLRPGETARVFLGVEEAPDSVVEAKHEWHKTNLVTIIKGRQNYDTVVCLRCGVTGKRYGLGDNGVQLDPRYRKAKKYFSCSQEKP